MGEALARAAAGVRARHRGRVWRGDVYVTNDVRRHGLREGTAASIQTGEITTRHSPRSIQSGAGRKGA